MVEENKNVSLRRSKKICNNSTTKVNDDGKFGRRFREIYSPVLRSKLKEDIFYI